MSAKNPDIATRLKRHPDIVVRRSPVVLWIGIGVSAAILVCWALLLLNMAALQADFASHQDTAVTLNQRIGSRFGVLIGAVALPLIAILPAALGWYFSPRFFRRATGTRLVRGYRGIFPGTSQQGAEFQNLVRTRDPAVIGAMNAGAERGNLIVEGWAAPADRVGYVGTFAFDLREDPQWELVEFSGPDFDSYLAVFGGAAGGASGSASGSASGTASGGTA